MRPSLTLTAAAAVAALSLLNPSTPADAAPTDRDATTGTVALYGASPTSPVWRATYATCSGQQASVRDVRSFDNRPADGCRVVLVEGSRTLELCTGRGQVPAGFQASPTVRIETGNSQACPVR